LIEAQSMVRQGFDMPPGMFPEADVPSPLAEGRSEVVTILDVPFARLALPDAIARVRTMVTGDGRHHIVLANAHTLNCTAVDPEYRAVVQRATLVLRDGVGVELAAKLTGQRLEHNFVGTDFVPLLLAALATPSVRVFLYGGRAGVAPAAGDALKRFSPAIEVVGCEDGYGDPEAAVQRILAAAPEVLLVARGNPHQETWIDANLARLNVRVAIGVGALFDFLAGRVVRSPRWVRRMRMEWVYRLWLEPGRLWRRYLVGNVVFMSRIAMSIIRDGQGRKS
jgi:exopolysaccharide biosynthesis WecB/TagA/CpsF family protein